MRPSIVLAALLAISACKPVNQPEPVPAQFVEIEPAISLRKVPPSEAPVDLRLAFLEEYLRIQRTDWKLDVSAGHEAKVTFHQKGGERVLLELTIPEKTVASLFLATVPDRIRSDRLQISFGDQHKSITTFTVLREGWKTKLGKSDGNYENSLFEIWDPVHTDGPIFWCEIHFQNK